MRTSRSGRLAGALLTALLLLTVPDASAAVLAGTAPEQLLPTPPLPIPPLLPEPPGEPDPTPEPPAPPAPAPEPPPTGPILHLTFDDGPDPQWTPQILDVLARHDAEATFFIAGERAAAHPDMVHRIVAAGHTVANHTYTHVDLTTVSQDRFSDEVGRTQAALGPDGRMCLRPPYGAVDEAVRDRAAAKGYRLQLWTVDTKDYRRPGAEVIADRIVAGARDGAVILMHDAGGWDRSQTVEGLALALDRLAGGDWRYEHTC